MHVIADTDTGESDFGNIFVADADNCSKGAA